MFWHLLLAHFIADYPLQPDWIVRNKTHFWVLFLHASIHFFSMAAVTLPVTAQIWPYLLILAATHFCIDTAKNWFNLHRPQWRAWLYLIDQACHFVSIGLISAWIGNATPQTGLLPRQAAVVIIAFLLVTYVHMISERILLGERPAYPPGTSSQVLARLFARAGLLGLLLIGWSMRSAYMSSPALVMPYPASRLGLRVLFVDLLVTLLAALLVIIINGSV